VKALLVASLILLTGCIGSGGVTDGGPAIPVDVSHVADAVPRYEVRTKAGNKSPYTVFGETYRVLNSSKGFVQEGEASWYGTKFHGNNTSNGEVYDMYSMTAAHKTLPIPSYVKVTNLLNGKTVVVRVNDRGPFHGGRIIDLSYAAATKLGYARLGTAQVRVDAVGPGDQGERPAKVKTYLQGADVLVDAKTDDYALPANTFLQVGAFSNKSRADQVSEKLAPIISEPTLVVESQTDSLFRVRLGPIESNIRLMNIRELLIGAGLPSAHVVYD
jgi:rare lipoprotein A